MGKYHIFQEITEFAPKIVKMGEIYTDSEMCLLEALQEVILERERGSCHANALAPVI